MRTWLSLFFLQALLIMIVLFAGCTAPSSPATLSGVAPTVPSAAATGTVAGISEALTLRIDSIGQGAVLPNEYSCKGLSVSPEVSWNGIPSGTKSLVLILDDPDAPSGSFTHWLVYNIPPATGSLSRAQPNEKVLGNGAQQGETTAGSRGYYPPCPPVGTTHRYLFRLYALDTEIAQPSANRDSIDSAMNGHIIGKTVFETKLSR